jgi:hypothetical protein
MTKRKKDTDNNRQNATEKTKDRAKPTPLKQCCFHPTTEKTKD